MKFGEFEDVEGWDPSLIDGGVPDEMFGPDHTEFPPSSDDLEMPEPEIFSPCGEENRVAINETSMFPWSAICYLIMKKGSRYFRGSGFFISDDTILTAGHCIYTKRSGYASSIQIIPGRNNRTWPYGSVKATEFYIPEEWRQSLDPQFDYGVIKLADSTLGQKTGHFKIANLDRGELEAAGLNTSGYPSDLKPSTKQHYNGGKCDAVYNQRLHYSLDTWKGASGSPVWVRNGDQRTAVGIHNYGHCPNKATRINDRVLTDLRGWKATT